MSALAIVGLGPGNLGQMTMEAKHALDDAELIFGYTGYIDLVKPLFPAKELSATPMRRELDRCRAALEAAAGGKRVCLVCSGDAGVYGMASPLFELSPEYPGVDITVVPGVTAALSCAALLGAPLGHDFAVISLSDRLTPWSLILKRLEGAVIADFVLCLYNPASHHRPHHLQKACDVLLELIPASRVCGVCRLAGREGQAHRVMTLQELRDYPADMFTTAFVGNSATAKLGDRMVTPRGYRGL